LRLCVIPFFSPAALSRTLRKGAHAKAQRNLRSEPSKDADGLIHRLRRFTQIISVPTQQTFISENPFNLWIFSSVGSQAGIRTPRRTRATLFTLRLWAIPFMFAGHSILDGLRLTQRRKDAKKSTLRIVKRRRRTHPQIAQIYADYFGPDAANFNL
jgi:hypothetical protein